MRIALTIVFIAVNMILFAQLDRYVIATSGELLEVDNLSLEFTLGEVIIDEVSSTDFLLTQGFHQPLDSALIDNILSNYTGLIQIYPNPSAGLLTIYLPATSQILKVNVFDSHGALCMHSQLETGITVLDLRKLSSGLYHICLYDQDYTLFEKQSIIIQH